MLSVNFLEPANLSLSERLAVVGTSLRQNRVIRGHLPSTDAFLVKLRVAQSAVGGQRHDKEHLARPERPEARNEYDVSSVSGPGYFTY